MPEDYSHHHHENNKVEHDNRQDWPKECGKENDRVADETAAMERKKQDRTVICSEVLKDYTQLLTSSH